MTTHQRWLSLLLGGVLSAAMGCGSDDPVEERTDFHRAANGAVYQNDELIIRPSGTTSFLELEQFCTSQDWLA